MREKRRLRPSPAMLVACLALFVALGGGAYAVKVKLKKNQVKTKNIKNGAVTTPKLAADATANNALKLGGQDANTFKTASNFTESAADQAITTAATIGNPIQVATVGTKRLLASASAHGTNNAAGVGNYLVCRLTIDGAAGVDDTDFASPPGATIVDASVGPLASAVVSPGTHTVALVCNAVLVGGATGSMTIGDHAVQAWAVSP